jgi:hypothetical protein
MGRVMLKKKLEGTKQKDDRSQVKSKLGRGQNGRVVESENDDV